MNKWSHIDTDTLIKLCIVTYDPSVIEASKDLLFSLLCDKNASNTFIISRGKTEEAFKEDEIKHCCNSYRKSGT